MWMEFCTKYTFSITIMISRIIFKKILLSLQANNSSKSSLLIHANKNKMNILKEK